MCGLVGVGTSAPTLDLSDELLRGMRDSLTHRGPDDAGTARLGDKVAFGHCRLSIIDLDRRSRQPMVSTDQSVALVYNGEIYNYRALREELREQGVQFRTESDTEVVLQAYRSWGEACVERFNGMFAFGIYDRAAEKLFLARDRAGEKPLFLRHRNATLWFASELKALFAVSHHPRVLDLSSLEFYMAYGYVPGDRSIIQGLQKLRPGHCAAFSLRSGRMTIRPYWALPKSVGNAAPGDTHELTDELHQLLAAAVERRLVADVPVGVMLSGGVDSSLIAALARAASGRPVTAFTVTFPGHGVFNEAPYARMVADHLSMKHVELEADPATFSLLPQLAEQYDEPIADSSMIPTYLVSRAIRRDATVALGGDGGDELFGGYPHYRWLLNQERVRQAVPGPIRWLVAGVTRRLPNGVRGRNPMLGIQGTTNDGIARINTFFDPESRRKLLAFGPSATYQPEDYKHALAAGPESALERAMRVDFQTYLVDDILVKVDRSSMLSSLEVRAPFLDPAVIEFAYGRVPDKLRANAGEAKILLRRLARRLLPEQLNLDRKQGFTIPMHSWLAGSWREPVEEILLSADERLFNRRYLKALWRGQAAGLANTNRIFAIVLFELWRRQYDVEIPL